MIAPAAAPLREGQMVPNIQLLATTGTPVKLSDYRRRSNMVLIFITDSGCQKCRSLLSEIAASYAEFRSLNAEVLAIFEGPMKDARSLATELKLPFPMLADETGEVAKRYLTAVRGKLPLASVFITDRFRELYAEIIAGEEADVPDTLQLLDWLQFIEAQCPE